MQWRASRTAKSTLLVEPLAAAVEEAPAVADPVEGDGEDDEDALLGDEPHAASSKATASVAIGPHPFTPK